MPEIRVQDEQGTVHVFPDGSTPEMIAGALGVKPPPADYAATRPGVQAPQNPIQQEIQQRPAYGLAGVPGGSSSPQPASDAYTAAVGVPLGVAATVMGGSTALPFIRPAAQQASQWVRQNPTKTWLAMEAAKQIPGPVGRVASKIPSWLPFLAGEGKGGPATESTPGGGKPTFPKEPLGPPTPSPELLQGRNLSELPATGARPEAQSGEALGKIPFLRSQKAPVPDMYTATEAPAPIPSTNEIRARQQRQPVPARVDQLETRGIQQDMAADLERHGERAAEEAKREFFAKNAPAKTKGDLIREASPIKSTDDLTEQWQKNLAYIKGKRKPK